MIRVESPGDQITVAKVYEVGQEQIFDYWDEIGPDERRSLLDQIATVDFGEFARLVKTHLSGADPDSGSGLGELKPPPLIPLPTTPAEFAARDSAREVGLETLRAGKVGVFLVAGGQGTRLGFDGPKGQYSVGSITGRTLFQFHAEKIVALQRKLKVSIPWIIMTSDANHEQTRQFFQENSNFGLNPPDVIFACQPMLPIVDARRGKILLDSRSSIALSPNGHGGAVGVIRGRREILKKRGIEYLFTQQVDNPLVQMCDPVFIGHHVQQGSEFSSKAVSKCGPEEKVGVFCRTGESLRVVEYTELDERERYLEDDEGRLAFRAGNIAQHVVSVSFFCPEDGKDFEMPYHVARKAVPYLRDGQRVEPDEPNSARFESFLFDVLPTAKNPVVLEVDRNQEFAPIKNAQGPDSAESCEVLMAQEWLRWFSEIDRPTPGVAIVTDGDDVRVEGKIEISPLFALDARDLAEKLEGRELPVEDGLLLE